MTGNKRGFTSYTNDSIRDPNLPDHLLRFKLIMESYMGVGGKAKVKLSTIAKAMGKERKSAERALKWFLDNSNLKCRRVGYIYEYYTDPDTSVLYGTTPVSHIMTHERLITKRSIEKELSKNPKDDLVNIKDTREDKPNPKDLSIEEQHLVDEIADWLSMDVFNPMLPRQKCGWVVRGNLIRYGFITLQKVYKEVAIHGANPHPSIFWERLKEFDNTPQTPK